MVLISAWSWTVSSFSTSAFGIRSVSPKSSSIKSLGASSLLEVLGMGLEVEGVGLAVLTAAAADFCMLPADGAAVSKTMGKINLPMMGHDLYSSGLGGFLDI